ncbi:hypothetical protein [Bacillus sp. KH172YL63]|uniref:hypothetical protein n=1 Tax=Bacillus sp. KH172YL63 TaxID=2709784 RepID=UPI0015648DA5|nr:hypothetical protein [Bacillus sp. KH172YL63]
MKEKERHIPDGGFASLFNDFVTSEQENVSPSTKPTKENSPQRSQTKMRSSTFHSPVHQDNTQVRRREFPQAVKAFFSSIITPSRK